MIKYPEKWQGIGCKIEAAEIAAAVQRCIQSLNVRNLSLSGGIDSTLLLHFMAISPGDPIRCYTIAEDENHPDFYHAKKAATHFGAEFHPYFLAEPTEPDDIVREFYKHLSNDGVRDIIAGDGIDEFACGYYSHKSDQSEQNYISWIRRLLPEHLIPLDENSGGVSVYLPYLSPEVVNILLQIPLYEKVDNHLRKKIIIEMAMQAGIDEGIINRWKYGFCDAAGKVAK